MASKDQSDLDNQESTPKLINIAQKGFAQASNYEKARNDYPLEAVKFLLKQLQCSFDYLTRPLNNQRSWNLARVQESLLG